MTWDEVCDDPSLQDLPYKIETNRYGQIVMSPHKRNHSKFQIRLIKLFIQHLPGGEPYPEAAIQTTDGIKAADLAWDTWERLEAEDARESSLFETAPKICVEVLSRSNPMTKMLNKMRLYFEAGAEEVWICDQKGKMYFYNPAGPQAHSLICPEFPQSI